MEAYNTTIYPVFEADQVLSQKELNNLVSHLEEQDRNTRKNLTGIGIVCGLELTFPTERSIKISCGTAVTSLGFQINLKEILLEDYRDYVLPDEFLHPDYTKEPHLDPIFKHSTQYVPIKNCVELLPSTAVVDGKLPIPLNFFDNKALILLLEVSLIDQKNCVTTNCDDKGKRIEFNIRPILVPFSQLTAPILKEYNSIANFSTISIPRYNVPYTKIVTGADVLKGFEKIYSVEFIDKISTSISTIYLNFRPFITATPSLDAQYQNLKNKINSTVTFYKTSNSVQYLWDWIYDIAQAYNEITEFGRANPSFCCVDEALFPFHVVLGPTFTTAVNYRTPFYKSSNSTTEENKKIKKATLLFERLSQIVNTYKYDATAPIKVTPSVYGDVALSKKSIPFYYDEILNLNKKWNPELTLKEQSDTILSYLSETPNYTTKPEVQKPLLFEIEKYNFFRVEGHIGKNYKTALNQLNLIKSSYALPFNITALNAVDFIKKEVDILKFDGRWDDLETDYDLSRKRVYNITEFVINWMDSRKVALAQQNIMATENINNFKGILSQIKNLLTDDLKAFLPNFTSFNEIFKQLNFVFLFHRWCIQFNRNDLSLLAEDLIDRLDDINELFLDDPFSVIYEEANLRWQKLYKDLFFSTFLKKHPGLDHKAGVTKGGTFVMVYVDSSIFKASAVPISHQVLLDNVKSYKNSFDIAPSIKQDLEKSVKFTDYKSQFIRPNTSSIDKCKAETDNIKNNLFEVAQNNLNANYSVEMSTFILANIKDVLQYDVNTTVDQNPFQQVIIADFFLPYLCCGGSGNTIEVKIETPLPLTITLDAASYCHIDESIDHEIIVQGKFGGTFSGDGAAAVYTSGNRYFLNPNHASLSIPKTYSLTYAVDGETSNTAQFEIFVPANDLGWTVVPSVLSNPNKFRFTNPNQTDTHEYKFEFGFNGIGSTKNTTEKTFEQVFPFNEINKTFVVRITQLGSICPNFQTLTVENQTGDYSGIDFSSPDFNI